MNKKSHIKLRRHFVGDVYGIIEGVRLGLGKAVLPMHLLSGAPGAEVINPKITLDIPVVLHYFKQPYYTRLHEAVVQTLTEKAPRLLDAKK